MTEEEQRQADREWLEEEIREACRLGNNGRADVYIRIRYTLLERDRLEEALWDYGTHTLTCIAPGTSRPCDCGYVEMMKSLTPNVGSEEHG